ncbi:hypothetical protein BH20ACT19_BH20ACT19_14470 [soil metagenome]
MPRIAYTVIALAVLAVALGLLGNVVDPDGVVWFAAFLVGVLLVSLTDRRRFGWIR